jgi:predicted  nucleic acid-binding Zn-ribbon protein
VRQELERKIEGYRMMQERKRAKLEFVRGAKEVAALMAELDSSRMVMAQEETGWLKSADRVEAAEVRVTTAKTAVDAVEEEQAPTRKELASKRKKCEKRMVVAGAERDEAKKTVDGGLLTRYERVRSGNAPFSLYGLHGDACGHCFTHVPKHIQQQLISKQVIDNCQVCGVMLFAVPEPAPEATPAPASE